MLQLDFDEINFSLIPVKLFFVFDGMNFLRRNSFFSLLFARRFMA